MKKKKIKLNEEAEEGEIKELKESVADLPE